MHPFFEPLDTRETLLLLTTLTVGGRDDVALFRFLPPETRARLEEKAAALQAIEAPKRVPFMVTQLKQFWRRNGLRGAGRIHPSWLLHGMRGESPRVVAALMSVLPTSSAASLLKRLPPGIRRQLPPRAQVEGIDPDVLQVVRRVFESRFSPMLEVSAQGFAYRDLVRLERAELYVLMRDLGLVELGQAFVSVGREALAELCRRLPREAAEELVQAVRSASTVDVPSIRAAQHFLSRIVTNFDDTEEFFQKSGLWRLAKGSVQERPDFRQAFPQRLPRTAGLLFNEYLAKAEAMDELDEAAWYRLQDSVLLRVLTLSHQKKINPQWRRMAMSFHDPQTMRALEVELEEDETPDAQDGIEIVSGESETS